jgi:hypothetical protein
MRGSVYYLTNFYVNSNDVRKRAIDLGSDRQVDVCSVWNPDGHGFEVVSHNGLVPIRIAILPIAALAALPLAPLTV